MDGHAHLHIELSPRDREGRPAILSHAVDPEGVTLREAGRRRANAVPSHAARFQRPRGRVSVAGPSNGGEAFRLVFHGPEPFCSFPPGPRHGTCVRQMRSDDPRGLGVTRGPSAGRRPSLCPQVAECSPDPELRLCPPR